jgi:hypothetical protein
LFTFLLHLFRVQPAMLNRMGHNNIRILLIVTLALQAQGAISFRAGRDQLLTGPPGPNAIAVADFNGDGHLDQAAVGFGEAVVYILLGEGNGRFRQVEAIPVGLNPVSIVTGDFNGDGNPDLAVGSEGAVSVLIGNGDGTFQAPVTYLKNVGNATAITSGDFNGDGKLDLAVAIGNNNYVYELPGNGDGTFAAPIKVFANADPFFVTAADLNGDGKLDLVVVNQAGVNSVLSILLGNGDGTFSKPKDVFNAANNGYWIAVADFNGDGIPDLALANQNAPNVTILLGTGGGNFGTPAAVDVGSTSGSRGLAVLDFNGDGKLDLAVVNFISGTLALAAGKGNGTFAAPKLMGMNQPAAVATGDFNGVQCDDGAVGHRDRVPGCVDNGSGEVAAVDCHRRLQWRRKAGSGGSQSGREQRNLAPRQRNGRFHCIGHLGYRDAPGSGGGRRLQWRRQAGPGGSQSGSRQCVDLPG